MSASSLATSFPEPPARAAAVIVAGGSGRRMGGELPKQYLEVCGEPILLRAVRPFVEHPRIAEVVVVLPATDADDPPMWLRELRVRVVAGGEERGDSVWNGLLAVSEDADPLLIHDGARPFVALGTIDRVLNAATDGGAVAGIPATDTIKRADADGRVLDTPDRSGLWQAQTPQAFPRGMILEAYRRARAAGISATDDAALCERLGWPVRMVLGSAENLKITRPADLVVAEMVASLLPRT